MKSRYLILALTLAALAPTAQAFDSGDLLVKLGLHNVDPKNNNGTLANGAFDAHIGSDLKPSIQAEYFFTPRIGVELLASVPFQHDVYLNGTKAGSFNHLPPTLSVQYHFGNDRVQPFLGAGVNFTWTYSEDTTGPLTGTELGIDNSWGLALHGGVDVKLNNGWYVGTDLRWIDLNADVSVNGAQVGRVQVDPLAYGLYVGWKF
jgi:outer membrane protein